MKKYILTSILLLIFMCIGINARAEEGTHIHQYYEAYTVKATCTQEGYTYYFCSCGKGYNAEVTKALGHSYSTDYIVIKEPCCTEDGVKANYCIRCYATGEESAIDKLLHKKESSLIKATTEKDGEKRISCILCGQVYNSEIIPSAVVSLVKNSFRYNGKNHRPTVVVRDREGKTLEKDTDYRITYTDKSKKPGEYYVTVTFMGDYEGEKKLIYTVLPSDVKSVKAEPSTRSVYLSWNKVKGADGYAVYSYKKKSKKYILIRETDNLYYTVNKAENKTLSYGSDYFFAVRALKNTDSGKIYSPTYTVVSVSTKPSKVAVKSCRKTDKSVLISWKKQKCDGYEILYADNKSFSSAKRITLKNKKSTKKNISTLSEGKTYFFKVRAYTIYKGGKQYGYFSESVSLDV